LMASSCNIVKALGYANVKYLRIFLLQGAFTCVDSKFDYFVMHF
jgi:ABC-type lipoprotein release transport system permease subunit